MKKLKFFGRFLFFALALFGILVNIAFANKNESLWYIKRNKSCRPELQTEQQVVYNYNGYYLDKKLSDTSEEKRIYLTFDLGYSNENVVAILDVLKERGVPGAFFILDNIILKNPDLVQRMKNEGHLICNHTKNHKNLCNMSEEEIKENVLALDALCLEKCGCEVAKYFRFPEGRYNERSLKVINELGYKTIFWSFAYEDWDNGKQPNPDYAIKKVLENTHNGGVFLFHPTSRTNAVIFGKLIDSWRALGYTFGTLDELVK